MTNADLKKKYVQNLKKMNYTDRKNLIEYEERKIKYIKILLTFIIFIIFAGSVVFLYLFGNKIKMLYLYLVALGLLFLLFTLYYVIIYIYLFSIEKKILTDKQNLLNEKVEMDEKYIVNQEVSDHSILYRSDIDI